MPTMEERVTRLEEAVENLAHSFGLHERRQEGEFKAISDKLDTIQASLATRLPTWATLLMTGMGSIIGVLVGVVATAGMR